MTDQTPNRERSGRRNRRPRRDADALPAQLPWKAIQNTDAPTEPVDEDGVQAVHQTAMRILSEIGIEFLNPAALKIFKKAGCTVSENNVRMDADFVMEMIGRAPSEFTITPRNPERAIRVGGNNLLFGNVSSPPNFWSLDGGKQTGNFKAFSDLVKMGQYFNCIHFQGGYPVEPIDVHASVRHLDCHLEKLIVTDKVSHAYSLGAERVEDAIEMIRIASGLSQTDFEASPHMFTNINSVSPLKHDYPMIDGALRCASRGQVVVVTPFTLAGAMAPVTMTGAVALSLAEGLAAAALLEFAYPGTPVVLGTFTSNVDMKSGAPAFGTPEYMRATQITGQMARFYGVPMRASGVCAANVPDGQAMWETSNSLWSAVQSRTNMVYHAAGWLEGGLIASLEKYVMDCEMLQMIQRYMEPAVVASSEGDLAFDAVKEVGPDGHFFGCDHTQDRYEDAFYAPMISDWRNFEAWEGDGAVWTAERAHNQAQRILERFTPPAIDIAIEEELRSFVSKRKEEGGAPTDF